MQNEPIALVSMGCVYPKANSTDELWNLCLEGKNIFTELSKDRWDIEDHYSSNRADVDKIYSKMAAEIPKEQYLNILNLYNLPSHTTRLEAYLHHCVSQVLADDIAFDAVKTGMVIGLMNPDDEYNLALAQKRNSEILTLMETKVVTASEKESLELFKLHVSALEKKRYERRDRFLSTDILESIGKRFNLKGLSFIVDSACASSLASLDLGISLLRSDKLETVLVGGAESNLSPGMFAVFSRVGALAENESLPFDQRTEGLVQGEGAGLFAIQKKSVAIAHGNPIVALIGGCDGSSDGKTSSLFQPDIKGQSLCYERVHSDTTKSLAHVEAHGTGTQVGDRTESTSISTYFKNQAFPISSIKSLIGHTKGAAGAAGLIKTIYLLKKGWLPKAAYMQKPMSTPAGAYISKDKVEFDSLDVEKSFGVSGFGFGGTNYHLTVQRNLSDETFDNFQESNGLIQDSFVVGDFEIDYSDFDRQWFLQPESPYRLPPQSLDRIDRTQLLAVQAVHGAMLNAGLSMNTMPTQDVVTISASILGLDLCSDLAARLQAIAFESQIKRMSRASLTDHKNLESLLEGVKENYQPCTEDHAPGLLNNVIAGRVCHAFNFRGRSYNIDAGLNSADYGLFLADLEIKLRRAPLVVLVQITESYEPGHSTMPVRRHAVSAKLITDINFCRKFFVKPIKKIDVSIGGSNA